MLALLRFRPNSELNLETVSPEPFGHPFPYIFVEFFYGLSRWEEWGRDAIFSLSEKTASLLCLVFGFEEVGVDFAVIQKLSAGSHGPIGDERGSLSLHFIFYRIGIWKCQIAGLLVVVELFNE